jgi:hypothetical protein
MAPGLNAGTGISLTTTLDWLPTNAAFILQWSFLVLLSCINSHLVIPFRQSLKVVMPYSVVTLQNVMSLFEVLLKSS